MGIIKVCFLYFLCNLYLININEFFIKVYKYEVKKYIKNVNYSNVFIWSIMLLKFCFL